MGVSLKPSDAVAGGGGIDNLDCTILQARFRLWDYNGTIPAPVLGLSIDFELEDGAKANQVYSAGDTKHFVPSPQDGGKSATAVGSLTGLVESTNAMAFLASLVNSGFPEDKIGDDISVIEGTKVHIDQVPQPKRGGLNQGDKGGNKTIGIVTKILSFPWDAKGAKPGPKAVAGRGKTAATTTTAPVAQGNGAVDQNDPIFQETVGHVMAVIAANGGSVAKKALSNEVFKLVQKSPNRNPIMSLAFMDAFLSGNMGEVPFNFDGSTVSMGG